jgi:ABC-type multidrug transport system ATPase subunit
VTLLQLENVTKRFRRGKLELIALRDISLEIHAGELIAVWGARGSGRSTLLRIAAGIERPDAGSVRLHGRELSPARPSGIPGGIAYCQPGSRGVEAEAVLQELVAAQLALGVKPSGARDRAWEALERVGARRCEERRPYELQRDEAVRVAIARALVQQPSLVVIDEPTTAVDVLKRDGILELLRSIATDATAVLMTVEKSTCLFGADRALSLSEGELHGHVSPELAKVVALPMRNAG